MAATAVSCWCCGAGRYQRPLDAVDDRKRRGIAVLDDAEQDRAAAILAHDILLYQRSVADLRDVLQKDIDVRLDVAQRTVRAELSVML